MTVTDTEILERIRAIFKENFAIDPERVTPEAHLFEELDLDSIDAVDLAIKLQEMTGRRIKPEEFKSVRTVGDVIAAVESLLAAQGEATRNVRTRRAPRTRVRSWEQRKPQRQHPCRQRTTASARVAGRASRWVCS